MKISKANYEILKASALLDKANLSLVQEAIRLTEDAEKRHNERMVKYITEKRKTDSTYCHKTKARV